ncbi:hypothetical protein KY320_03660, partial [Candidatus Woesearchaeota archaeon]|nr:hypothetical protein [Candidatus Woesearchaeota archaeon]
DAYPGAFADIQATKEQASIIGGAAGASIGTLTGLGLVIAGVAACSTVVGCGFAVVASSAAGLGLGGYGGYIMGADTSQNWDARIMLWDYDQLNTLKCSRLESKVGSLEIHKEEKN